MAKYDALFEHLCHRTDEAVSMSFDEIERLVGPLPASATRQRAWWSNGIAGTRHVQASAWLNAGREVESVDPDRRTVRFSAPRWRRGS